MVLDPIKHFGAEPESRTERELDVQPQGENHVVVQQGSKHEGQPSFGQQNPVRVTLNIVHPLAVSSGDPTFYNVGQATHVISERHERVHVQQGRYGLQALDQCVHHVFEFRRRVLQSRSVDIFKNNSARASHLLQRTLAQVIPGTDKDMQSQWYNEPIEVNLIVTFFFNSKMPRVHFQLMT